MVLWRISRHQNLSGTGGLRASGRWHYAGHPVVYLSGNPASALLEVCIHTSANDVPPSFTLLRIEGPDLDIPSVAESDLPDGWRVQIDVTQELGTSWLRQNSAVLLEIPSAIVPETVNYLFNPAHQDAKAFVIEEVLIYPFDSRIKL